MNGSRFEVEPIPGLPEIEAGYPLGEAIAARLDLRGGEIVVISQKAVSKAEGRLFKLSDVKPGEEAERLAGRTGKDARLVELILAESRKLLRVSEGVIITETRQGLICANAGIDASNMPAEDVVALLPLDPDESARRIRRELATALPAATLNGRPRPAVVISDSFGRPWRLGQAETAIGCAGLVTLDDWRGRQDSAGRALTATAIAAADQVAAAADLARDKTSRTPAVVIRGLARLVSAADGPGAVSLLRPEEEDLFR